MSTDPQRDPIQPRAGTGERLVYLAPADQATAAMGDEIDLREVARTLWNGRWMILAVILLAAAASVAYALLAREWWRVDVVLSPVESQGPSRLPDQLGGLAALAGISLSPNGNTADSLAVLKSRAFARDFIEDHELVPVLFADKWDAAEGRWREDNLVRQPDIRDAVQKFQRDVLSVSQDNKTKLVTVSVRWTDAEAAAAWAAELVDRVNERMRQRALERAQLNLAYLNEELGKTGVVSMQQAIGRLIENEMQTVMLARGNPEFAFSVIDPAAVPRRRDYPKRALVVALGTVGGLVLGMLGVLGRAALRRNED